MSVKLLQRKRFQCELILLEVFCNDISVSTICSTTTVPDVLLAYTFEYGQSYYIV